MEMARQAPPSYTPAPLSDDGVPPAMASVRRPLEPEKPGSDISYLSGNLRFVAVVVACLGSILGPVLGGRHHFVPGFVMLVPIWLSAIQSMVLLIRSRIAKGRKLPPAWPGWKSAALGAWMDLFFCALHLAMFITFQVGMASKARRLGGGVVLVGWCLSLDAVDLVIHAIFFVRAFPDVYWSWKGRRAEKSVRPCLRCGFSAQAATVSQPAPSSIDLPFTDSARKGCDSLLGNYVEESDFEGDHSRTSADEY